MAIPPELLDKADKLSRDELEMVRSHSDISGRFLRVLPDCPLLVEIADIACAHHERYDGQGYPKMIAGEAIPLAARILAVADAFDAMTTPKSYRPGMTPGAAVQRLQLNSGTQFDPDVVDAASRLYHQDMGKFLSATVAGVSLTAPEEDSNPFASLDMLKLSGLRLAS
jgi:HD-GYP domain-containing protein (c-di-GMP phosphodiesterase class II)